MIILFLIDAAHEAGVDLEIVEAEIREFLEFAEMMPKMPNADTAAEFLEGMAEVTESFQLAESAVFRYLKPKPST